MTPWARSTAPLPPSAQWLDRMAFSAPAETASSRMTAISASVSVANLLIATTTGIPNDLALAICFLRAEGSTRGDRGGTSVDLESSDCGNDDNDVWNESRGTALDVEESLTSHGEVKASLSDDKSGLFLMVFISFGTGKLQCKLVSKNRALSDANIGKGASMDKDGSALEGLHEVRLDSILHESSEGTASTKVVVAESEDSHTLTSNSDVESGLSRLSLLSGGGTHCDASQVTVIHVENSPPSDGLGVNIQSSESVNLVFCQLVGVGLVDSELLQTTEHDRSKLPRTILDGD
ncbi:hypothetical protein HG531_007736 [Fusarium graminearum]|nr:hypothetical protein HG531_007736 [Fusarium graminearum]